MPVPKIECSECGSSIDARGLKSHLATHRKATGKKGKLVTKKVSPGSLRPAHKTQVYPLSPITGQGSIRKHTTAYHGNLRPGRGFDASQSGYDSGCKRVPIRIRACPDPVGIRRIVSPNAYGYHANGDE